MTETEISVTAADGRDFAAYLSVPPSGHGPGLLVLPEIYNANKHIRGVADGFAAEGFVALAPDVYWRLEHGAYLPYTAEGQARARALNKRLDLDRLIADLGACATTLRGRPECHGKVGGIGFCLGGKLAYLCAARLDVDAAVSYYGVKIEAFLDEADNVTCPLLLHFAGNDSHVPPDAVAAVRARLTDKSNVTIHVYTGAEHGFNRAGYPPYDAASAKLARVRSLDLLERALS
ncbi:MAG: dienelactone hydrolase family protein [Alphaproteobacteria bacterium]|nr:dienelactone hydrolase family protein [Alphaproteobacteria bacterium]MDP6517019.1 dienelactone hydrolase family protein [Alphaproteobacteria bacterium]